MHYPQTIKMLSFFLFLIRIELLYKNLLLIFNSHWLFQSFFLFILFDDLEFLKEIFSLAGISCYWFFTIPWSYWWWLNWNLGRQFLIKTTWLNNTLCLIFSVILSKLRILYYNSNCAFNSCHRNRVLYLVLLNESI